MHALSISIVESAPLLVAAVRRRVTAETIIGAVVATPVWAQMENRGMANTGRAINVLWSAELHDIGAEGGIDADLGAEVLAPFNSDATLSFVETPTGRAATTEYHGDYWSGVPDAHRTIKLWCAEQGHRLAGPAWEVHTWNDDPELRVWEISYLLA